MISVRKQLQVVGSDHLSKSIFDNHREEELNLRFRWIDLLNRLLLYRILRLIFPWLGFLMLRVWRIWCGIRLGFLICIVRDLFHVIFMLVFRLNFIKRIILNLHHSVHQLEQKMVNSSFHRHRSTSILAIF